MKLSGLTELTKELKIGFGLLRLTDSLESGAYTRDDTYERLIVIISIEPAPNAFIAQGLYDINITYHLFHNILLGAEERSPLLIVRRDQMHSNGSMSV